MPQGTQPRGGAPIRSAESVTALSFRHERQERRKAPRERPRNGPTRPRMDMTPLLRADIRRIGTLLGQTRLGRRDDPLLDLVEEVRALVRAVTRRPSVGLGS